MSIGRGLAKSIIDFLTTEYHVAVKKVVKPF